MMKTNADLTETNQDEAYHSIRSYIVEAHKQVYSAVNSAMVIAYWNIGKTIYEVCVENDRAAYGKKVLKYISERLTEEFGRGFDESNLRKMRRFYQAFPIRDALRPELSWTHYRLLMKVNDTEAREFYLNESVRSFISITGEICSYRILYMASSMGMFTR